MPDPLNPVSWLLSRRAAARLRRHIAWLTPQLAQGPNVRAQDAKLLAAMGIGSVLDLREEAAHDPAVLDAAGLRYRHVAVREFEPVTPAQLEDGARWALAEMAAGRSVFVHCRQGLGRSVGMACAILIAQGHGFDAALKTARAARPQTQLTESQLRCLDEYARRASKL